MSYFNASSLRFRRFTDRRLAFLRQFIAAPRQVGSLAPSAHFLGDAMREMVAAVSPERPDIAVFGIGTGAVASRFSGYRVFGYDTNPHLVALARRRMPLAEIAMADVLAPDFTLTALGADRPVAIVSCIPVVNLTVAQRTAFEARVDRLLDDPRVACFLQYSYLPRPPLRIPQTQRQQRWVFRNLPPAGIHLWSRKGVPAVDAGPLEQPSLSWKRLSEDKLL